MDAPVDDACPAGGGARRMIGPDRLDRLVAGEVLRASLLVLAVFVALDWLLAFLDAVDDRSDAWGIAGIVEFVLLTTPRRLWEVVPYVALLGALVGLSQLGARGELVVMRAAGRSLGRIVSGALLPAIALVLVGALLGEGLGPVAEREAQARRASAEDGGEIRVRGGSWHEADGVVTHARRVGADGTLGGVAQYAFDAAGELREVVDADRAVPLGEAADGSRRWRLEDVSVLALHGDGVARTRPGARIWRSDADPERFRLDALVAPARLSLPALVERIGATAGPDADRFRLALWQKLGQPLSVLALVLVGSAFVFGPLREAGMGARLAAGIGAGLAFRYLQDLLAPAALVFDLAPALAVLGPIALATGLGLWLLRRAG
jgi:lipopolysaccharide export system permease protein